MTRVLSHQRPTRLSVAVEQTAGMKSRRPGRVYTTGSAGRSLQQVHKATGLAVGKNEQHSATPVVMMEVRNHSSEPLGIGPDWESEGPEYGKFFDESSQGSSTSSSVVPRSRRRCLPRASRQGVGKALAVIGCWLGYAANDCYPQFAVLMFSQRPGPRDRSGLRLEVSQHKSEHDIYVYVPLCFGFSCFCCRQLQLASCGWESGSSKTLKGYYWGNQEWIHGWGTPGEPVRFCPVKCTANSDFDTHETAPSGYEKQWDKAGWKQPEYGASSVEEIKAGGRYFPSVSVENDESRHNSAIEFL